MVTESIFKGRPLVPGEQIPGTVLTFVRPVLRRRAEFRCVCGVSKAYDLYRLENGTLRSCGCNSHRKVTPYK